MIHGELRTLGFEISERTVLRWMQIAPRSPELAKRWATSLSNHREVFAAMDCFAASTLTLGIIYCFFVISHDPRRILHCNATMHPTSAWVSHQLRETFPYDNAPKHLLFDRAGISVRKLSERFGVSTSNQSGLASAVRGKTESPNASSAVVGETCSIM